MSAKQNIVMTRSHFNDNFLLLPDCANLGVLFKILFSVNTLFFVSSFLNGMNFNAAFAYFLELVPLIELTCLLSMAILVGVQQIAKRCKKIASPGLTGNAIALLSVLICMAVAGFSSLLTYYFFQSMAPWQIPSISVLKIFISATLLGACVQHYFALRARAYSPQLAQAQLQALQARIRPHFLFNSLNAILALIRRQPKQAETALQDLADVFRVLIKNVSGLSSLAQELQLCHQYLSIEQLRLADRLQVDWQIEDLPPNLLEKIQVPVLILQPLIENAIYHGIEQSLQPACILIRIWHSPQRVHIYVKNPISKNEVHQRGSHIALDNIKERLFILYDIEGQIQQSIKQDAQISYFIVELSLPI